ncbi:unnamed protein product [Ostreobium quekettii]|uniref:Glutaredoxin-dependent peroxiredoxin n=1 Tax=Ostreobium quekettii TaxID=121088 RepID=A0A8S1IPQ3_9CHLO|nr:unnamed protein product [Ostreobium quekettii]|eukprot:evm.model.scf_242.8 EVM.evm.TU.scf_242.8   scf_242:98968-102282(-)
MAPKVGDELPDSTLYEGSPGGAVKIRELFAGKKGVIVGVPGAFTPTCSKTHLPSYISNFDKLKEAGADVVVTVSVNDPFVMEAWGESLGVGDKVRMLADTRCEFTKAVDLSFDATPFLGNERSQRYAMLVVDNVIKAVNVEASPGEATCSLADPVVELLKAM